MALNFPNSPTNGEIYTDVPSGNRWVWDSANTVWKSTSTFTQTITVSSSAPGSPVVGQLWWNQDYGRLLVYYSDGTSSQWVDASPSDYTSSLAYLNSNAAFAVANTALQNTSVTLAGNLTVTGNVVVKSNTLSINSVNVSPYGTMKNRIINGDMRIDQRFAGAANNNIAAAQYVVDRWLYSGVIANKLRYQQNNTNGPGTSATQLATGFSSYFGANVVSSNTVNSNDYWLQGQIVEGINVADLNWGTNAASPATLSFWVYSSVPGTHSGSLRNADRYDRSYVFSYTVSAANTWQYQTITIPGDTSGVWSSNNNGGISFVFSEGVGSTFTTTANGTWQAGNYFNATGAVNVVSNANGSFYLTGVQFEKGNQATSWDWRHYTTELQLCQRYYYKMGPYTNGSQVWTASGLVPSTTAAFFKVFLPVVPRTTPVFGMNPSYSSWQINIPGLNNYNISSAPGVVQCDGTSYVFSCPSTISGSYLAYGCDLYANPGSGNNNYIDFSAELGVSN